MNAWNRADSPLGAHHGRVGEQAEHVAGDLGDRVADEGAAECRPGRSGSAGCSRRPAAPRRSTPRSRRRPRARIRTSCRPSDRATARGRAGRGSRSSRRRPRPGRTGAASGRRPAAGAPSTWSRFRRPGRSTSATSQGSSSPAALAMTTSSNIPQPSTGPGSARSAGRTAGRRTARAAAPSTVVRSRAPASAQRRDGQHADHAADQDRDERREQRHRRSGGGQDEQRRRRARAGSPRGCPTARPGRESRACVAVRRRG